MRRLQRGTEADVRGLSYGAAALAKGCEEGQAALPRKGLNLVSATAPRERWYQYLQGLLTTASLVIVVPLAVLFVSSTLLL